MLKISFHFVESSLHGLIVFFYNFGVENYSNVFANLVMALPRLLAKTQLNDFIPLSNEKRLILATAHKIERKIPTQTTHPPSPPGNTQLDINQRASRT